jgi:sarcosine oxidase delta subunit
MGCAEWFLATRDTRTNEIAEITVPDTARRA